MKRGTEERQMDDNNALPPRRWRTAATERQGISADTNPAEAEVSMVLVRGRGGEAE